MTTLLNIARPLTVGNDGAFSSDENISDLVKQNLKNLLLTQKGERVMRRSFGTSLTRLLFEQKTDQLKMSIAEEITGAVSTWMNYIVLDAITIVFSHESLPEKFRFLQDAQENEVKIIIEFRFNALSKTIREILDLTVEVAESV